MADLAQPPPDPLPVVLVVEDDPALRRLLELRLSMDGFDVQTARDGQEALDLIAGPLGCPDILVCDIMMPRLSGLAVCTSLRAAPSTEEVPIILLSAHSMDGAIEAVLELGNIGFMNKPFNAIELRDKIRGALTACANR